MLPTIYEVERIGSGLLSIMGRPRAGEWVTDEFQGLSQLGVTDIISLLESHEAQELGLSEEEQFCTDVGIEFHAYPIPDRGLPRSSEDVSRLACATYHRCAGGRHTAIHCRAGIGRSGLIVAAVLLHCGFEVSEAFEAVSKARGIRVPDTEEQAEWLAVNQKQVLKCHLGQAQ